MRLIAEYVGLRSKLPQEEIDWMESVGQPRTLRQGDAFCQIGQDHHEYGFLVDGILQVYGVSSRGEKVVLDFIFPGAFALAVSSATRGLPSDVCFEAVTFCTLRVWPYEMRHTAFARHPEWLKLGLRMAEDSFNQKQRRYMEMRVLSAEERYVRMTEELPEVWRRLPQHLIASYLGITPQYLSRVKRANRGAGRSLEHAGRRGTPSVLLNFCSADERSETS